MQLSLFDHASMPSPMATASTDSLQPMSPTYTGHLANGVLRSTMRIAPAPLQILAANIRRLTTTSDADTHAHITEGIARAVLPHAERVASLAVPSWPDRALDLEDLVQELVVEVLASLPWAPVPAADDEKPGRLGLWLSSTLLKELHNRFRKAKAHANREQTVKAFYATATPEVETDEEGGFRLVAPAPSEPHRSLHQLLSRLAPADAALLKARAKGESWVALARRLHCSERTARRRYERALAAARRTALTTVDHGAPALRAPMLPGIASPRAAA